MKLKHLFYNEVPWSRLRRAHRKIILSLFHDLTPAEIQSANWTVSRTYGWHPLWTEMRFGRHAVVCRHGDFRGGIKSIEEEEDYLG